jgi:hypothetical protein
MNIHELVEQLRNYKDQASHRSTMEIYNLLENNKTLFLKYIDPENFTPLLSNFEALSFSSPKDYATADYKREFQKLYDLLMFYSERII